jgi:transcription antitermination factor NusG
LSLTKIDFDFWVEDCVFDAQGLDNCWLAIQVRSGWELRIAQILHASGHEGFVPTYAQKRQWSRRVSVAQAPLFTGYVFFRFHAWNKRPVVFIPGVIRFVGMGSSPTPIDPSEMEALKIANSACIAWGPCPFLAPGTMVEIQSGPLIGLKGHVVRFKNRTRLIINVNLIQQSVFVEIEEQEVRPR